MLVRVALFLVAAVVSPCYGAASVGMYSKPTEHFNIGLVLPIHKPNMSVYQDYDIQNACGDLDNGQMLQATKFIKLIDTINQRNLLPGISLGYSILDSCGLPNIALIRASSWGTFKVDASQKAPAKVNMTSEYCPVDLVIGGYNSRVSHPLTMYLQLFEIPLIDTGATLGDLTDRRRYNYYARVTPSDKHQAKAMAEMAQKLGFQCVHLVYSEGLYGEMGADDLRLRLAELGICVVSDQLAPSVIKSTSGLAFDIIVAAMSENVSTAGVVCFCEDTTIKSLVVSIKQARGNALKMGDPVPRFVIMGSDYWSTDLKFPGLEDVTNGAVTVTVGLAPNATNTPSVSVDDLVSQLNDSSANPWLKEFFQNKFQCTFDTTNQDVAPCDLTQMTLAKEDIADSSEFQSLYTASMTGIQGLMALLKQVCPTGPLSSPNCISYVKSHVQELYNSIISQTVDLSDFGDPPFKFDKNGEGPGLYTFNNLRQVTVQGDYGTFTVPEYVPIGVWSTQTAPSYLDSIAAAKIWQDTNKPIASTCNCNLTSSPPRPYCE